MKQPVRGFTLIELLVAVAAMAVLTLMSWRAIDGMVRTRSLTEDRGEALSRIQATLGQWKADLDALVDTEELTPLSFDGRLLRLTRRDAADQPLHSQGVRVVAWVLGPPEADGTPRWMRWQSAPLRQRDELARAWQAAQTWSDSGALPTSDEVPPDSPTTDGPTASAGSASALATLPATTWQIYYHRGQSWGNPLSAEGSSTGDATSASDVRWPDGVRLVLALPGGQGFAGTLTSDWVRPTLKAGS
ncbi:PulJ/GspJ family protein [Hydrogenophaga electricum]|uniref:Prepilin-type N-terminal cleavage/methylation domain-containing protein n=1 Tax=Hydrogenophaga electricum TaxID=1230953 RepID=A0ABQ6C6N2_9BURK|nr:prepilin-type N-terminal cleavage/methylation domain-containing protein [Hydrogenophaga electricum]GLS15774.1 hypothetical protein GCM10007935_32110 [Hydrogenophaga electricum]